MGLSSSLCSFPGLALVVPRCPFCSQPCCSVSCRTQGDAGTTALPVTHPRAVCCLKASPAAPCVCLQGTVLPPCLSSLESLCQDLRCSLFNDECTKFFNDEYTKFCAYNVESDFTLNCLKYYRLFHLKEFSLEKSVKFRARV